MGIELGQRLTLTALLATLFAAASSPPHLPMHPRPLQVVEPDASPLVVHPTSSPSILDPTCRHPHRRRRQSPPLPPRRSHRTVSAVVLVCGRGAWLCACAVPGLSILLWSSLQKRANYLARYRVFSLRVGISQTAKKSRYCASKSPIFASRGAAPHPAARWGYRPRPRFCKWCARV